MDDAYDMMEEALKATLKGKLTPEGMMEQISNISAVHILSKVAQGNGDFNFNMGAIDGSGDVTVHVVATVTKGNDLAQEVIEELESTDVTDRDIKRIVKDTLEKHSGKGKTDKKKSLGDWLW